MGHNSARWNGEMYNWQGCSFNVISAYGSISFSENGSELIKSLVSINLSIRECTPLNHFFFNEHSGSFPVTNHLTHGANRCEFNENQHLPVLHFSEVCFTGRWLNQRRLRTRYRYKAKSVSWSLCLLVYSPLLTLAAVLHNADHEGNYVLPGT